MARLEFLTLQLQIAGCPNACRHCGNDGRPPFGALMSVDDARWVLEQFQPLTDVLSPYVFFDVAAHPDVVALEALCQEFCNDAEGSDWSVFSTNAHGIVTAEDPEGVLHGLRRVGVRMLCFTLHGEREHHDWFVCRRGAFDDIWRTAHLCADVGLGTGFNFFVDRRNAADLHPFLDRTVRLREETGVDVFVPSQDLVLYWANRRLRVYERKLRPRPADLEPIRGYLAEQWGCELEDLTEGNWVRRLLDPADPLPRPQRPPRHRRSVGFWIDPAFDVWEYPPLREHAPVRHGNLRSDSPDAIINRFQAWQQPDYPGVEELAALHGDRHSDLLHHNPTSLYVKWIDRWLSEHGGTE